MLSGRCVKAGGAGGATRVKMSWRVIVEVAPAAGGDGRGRCGRAVVSSVLLGEARNSPYKANVRWYADTSLCVKRILLFGRHEASVEAAWRNAVLRGMGEHLLLA